jgi:nitrite reductase/ring-hydroxylating ferredoxin subunit/Fe-S cluster biogenesis protein NfuA
MSTGTPTLAVEDLNVLAERVDQAINEVQKLDGSARVKAMALKQAIEDFHKLGITKIVQRLKADAHGKELLFELVDDPAVYALFAMHGIVRADVMTRAVRVLEMVRPYMRSHGGDVELVEVRGDTAYVKLHGSCNGCSMSAVTLREGVEEALTTHIPEIHKVEVMPNDPGPAILLMDIPVNGQDTGWLKGPRVEEVEDGRPYRMDADELSIVIINLDNKFHAYRNECAHMGLPLDGGMLDAESSVLTCPWHGFRFDATTGECLTAPQAQLEAFPLRIDNGYVWVRPT